MRICSFLLLASLFAQHALADPVAAPEYGQGHLYPRHRDGHRSPGLRRADPGGDGYYIRHHESNQGRRFEWTKPALGATSVCVELDTETGGEKYRLLVEDGNCPKMETVLEWSAPEDGRHSRCYSVDSLTMGLRYRRLEDEKKCPRPPSVMVWLQAESDTKQNCYEIDSETRGKLYRRAAHQRLCPRTVDPYVAFGRYEPLKPIIPLVERPALGGGRMPASLSQPSDEPLEERDPKEFWEDPEDMIRHVPEGSRKGHY